MAVENLTLAPFFSNQRNPYNYAKIEQVARDIMTEWLTLDEITQQINLYEDDSQDSYLTGLELAVRMAIEDYLGYSIFSTTYRTYYANPGLYNSALYLDLPEASPGLTGVTVNSVIYYTGNGATTAQVLAPTAYFYDSTGSRVVITEGMPETVSQTMANPIVCQFTVNANPIAQYPVIKQAGLLLFTHLYNNRSDTTEMNLKKIPFGVEQLLRPYKPLVM